MTKAQPQNLESIAALQSFCIFGYQTDDPLAAVAAPDYFAACSQRLMANDLMLICADAAANPAWGLFLVTGVAESRVGLANVATLSPEMVKGLTFLRSQAPLSFKSQKRGAARRPAA